MFSAVLLPTAPCRRRSPRRRAAHSARPRLVGVKAGSQGRDRDTGRNMAMNMVRIRAVGHCKWSQDGEGWGADGLATSIARPAEPPTAAVTAATAATAAVVCAPPSPAAPVVEFASRRWKWSGRRRGQASSMDARRRGMCTRRGRSRARRPPRRRRRLLLGCCDACSSAAAAVAAAAAAPEAAQRPAARR